MAKHKMVQYNLLKNAIAAYFAAVEIHNKPNIAYRYETVSLLIMNAWELLLKAFVRKYIKSKSIFEDSDYTISFDKALAYTNDYINGIKPKSFTATQVNLTEIEKYRNNTAHFYNEKLDPYIFMLVARASLNFVDFIRLYFSKDIITEDNLFIMPLGFKLPFEPKNFLNKKTTGNLSSKEARRFIDNIVTVIEDLKEQGIEDSIVLGFNVYLESVKKVSNSDLLAAITNKDEADISITNPKKVIITNDPSAQQVYISEKEIEVPDADIDKDYPFIAKDIAARLGIKPKDAEAMIWKYKLKGQKKFNYSFQTSSTERHPRQKYSQHAIDYLNGILIKNKEPDFLDKVKDEFYHRPHK